MPEPAYDKFGAAIIYECRPSGLPVGPNYPARLPICDQQCPPGTVANPNAAASPSLPQCVPVPEGSDGSQPRNPGIGNPNTGP